MEKIRILFTIPNFLTAGSGREMLNIIERLDKDLFEPFIAVQQAGGDLYVEIQKKGYPIITEQFSVGERVSLFGKLIESFLLAKKFRPYNFHIWQSFNWSSDYTEAMVANFSGARYVYVKKNMNWNRLAWKAKSHLSSAIVARNSTLMNGPLSASRLHRKTFFVPGGVFSNISTAPATKLRDSLCIPSDVTVVSCIAHIVRPKDQLTLIKAVREIENVCLVLAGAERDVEYAKSLRDLVAAYKLEKRVVFMGAIGNVTELLYASDIFVLPTTNRGGHEEGCPVALLEAMAAGVPCIASDVAGSRDLIQSHQTGLLFSPENSLELAECIKYYIDNPNEAKRLADYARKKVATDYSLEKEASGFSNMYLRMLKR